MRGQRCELIVCSKASKTDVALHCCSTHCFVNLLAIGQSHCSVKDNNLLPPDPGCQLFDFHLSDFPHIGQALNTEGDNVSNWRL